ncbi:MAG: hypothetical protein Q9159_004673 [Coniocarpon cinnabarinum]
MSAPNSASSSATMNGQIPSKPSPGTPNGPPPGFRPNARRPPKPANPLAATKSTRRFAPPARPNNGVSTATNGARPQNQPPLASEEEYEDIPIFSTRRSLIEGAKHHILRFAPAASSSEQTVDIFNASQFERPIRLHRRDPHINHVGNLDDNPNVGEQAPPAKTVDDKEREKQEILKAERRAEREADQALIAPTNKSQKPKKDKPRKDQNFVQSYSDNVNKQKNMTIRYEEKLPWHVEDFDNKQTWRGAYEYPLSENHVALIESRDRNGHKIYQMLPMQKWYKFSRKNQYKTLSYQAAESAMKKGAADPLWIRKARIAEERTRRASNERDAAKGIFARKSDRGEQALGGRIKFEDEEQRETAVDADDIDFNAEEDFADDEEGPAPVGKEEEDEAKEVNQRVKKEQLEANIFEIKDQKDWDAEEEAEKMRRKAERKHRKRMRKALQEREKNFDFDEESEEDDSSGDSDDSEIERLKEEEKRHEEELKALESKGGKDKVASGASTARTGTPNPVRPSKPDDPRRKVLKRAGSPNLSDASGNESSSRKKLKQKHGPSALAGDGATASRPGSPGYSATTTGGPDVVAPAPLRPGVKLNLDSPTRQASPTRAGGTSDVEMSDSGALRKKKKKGSGNSSPRESRPGSPEGAHAAERGPVTSQANIETIKASIPNTGVTMNAFVLIPKIKVMRNRDTKAFTNMLKAHADYDAASKMLYPKGRVPKPNPPAGGAAA